MIRPASIFTASLALTSGVTYAQDFSDEPAEEGWFSASRFGVGAYASTVGIGGYLTYDVTDWLYLRAQAGGFSYDRDFDYDDIDYDADLSLFAAGISANINPFHKVPVLRGFRVSLGLFNVDNEITAETSFGQEIEDLGNANSFVLGADDRLVGEVSYAESLTPYAGLGWDFMFGKERQFTLTLDAGVFFTGSADVSLTAEGAFADFARQNGGLVLQDEIDRELEELRDDTDDFEIYPLVSLGFIWRF